MDASRPSEMDRGAFEAYAKATNTGRRYPEPPPEHGAVPVDADRVRWYRARAMHMSRRLPAAAHPVAAAGGLQDSSPRSALLSLHARMDGVGPDDWEHPSLVQVWFRWSDYVVPRDDVAAFTLGALPRDPAQASALDALADAVVRALDGRPATRQEVAKRMPQAPTMLFRSLSVTGKVHIRWDASSIVMVPAEPAGDPEDARRDLGRRFLHWHGPAGPDLLAKWAGVSRGDAKATWAALSGELVPVDFEGRGRWILASDERALRDAAPPRGVRLLPPGDPYLYVDPEIVSPPADKRVPDTGPTVSQRLVNSLSGRIMSDGEIVGSWGRVQANLTLYGWRTLPDSLDAEVHRLAGPLGKPPTVRRLS